MANEKLETPEIRILHSRIAALEQLIEVYEDSVVEQADKLYGEIAEHRLAEEALQKSEACFRGLLESSPDAMVIVNTENGILMVNEQLEMMFGYGRAEILGKKVEMLIPARFSRHSEQSREYVGCPARRSMGQEVELYALRRDGSEFPVEVSLSPLETAGGTIVSAVVRDITERKRAKEDIQRLNEALEAKIEQRTRELSDAQEELLRREKLNMLGIVAANVGNELRNPLGVMNNAVYYLSTLLADADQSVREYLEIIGKEIEGSQRVLSDFIDFFRAAPPRARYVPVDELISQSLAVSELQENVTVSVEVPEALPVKVDPSQMRQVFRNLITNAAQAMPEGGALRICARRVPGSRLEAQGYPGRNIEPGTSDFDPVPRFVEISVADSGPGIPRGHMQKVFQPLFSTKARGIGLGLSICKSFTESNGGRIEVESEQGKGACFTVQLPIGVAARGSEQPGVEAWQDAKVKELTSYLMELK